VQEHIEEDKLVALSLSKVLGLERQVRRRRNYDGSGSISRTSRSQGKGAWNYNYTMSAHEVEVLGQRQFTGLGKRSRVPSVESSTSRSAREATAFIYSGGGSSSSSSTTVATTSGAATASVPWPGSLTQKKCQIWMEEDNKYVACKVGDYVSRGKRQEGCCRDAVCRLP